MATKVYTEEEIELQDGTTVQVKPLTIKRLRKFMKLISSLNKIEDIDSPEGEDEAMDIMFEASVLALEQNNPEVAADKDKLEDALDMPTMWKLLEIAGGVSMGNAGSPVTGLAGRS